MTRLIIIRHGNTFAPGETPRRVGGRTDIPLVESGIEQAKALGRHFKDESIVPDIVFTSELQRTKQTSAYILEEFSVEPTHKVLEMFNEVDYGPDENQVEEVVINRIGKEALQKWDAEAIVPNGWEFDPKKAISDWLEFSQYIQKEYSDRTVMAVTSNGIARFAPHITGEYENFLREHNIKMKTGSYSDLLCKDQKWSVTTWNRRP